MTVKAHSGIRRGGGSGKRKGAAILQRPGSGGGGGHVQPIDITPFRNWTLQQVEGRLRGLDHEELFVFDAKGKVIAAYKGKKKRVSFPYQLFKQQQGITITHNHPKGEENFGGSFSLNDMQTMLKFHNWREHRVVAEGQGERLYIIRRGHNAQPKEFASRIKRDKRRLTGKMARIYLDAYEQASMEGKSKEAADHIARQKSVGQLHTYYKRNAPKHGFVYITRKKPHKSDY